MHRLPQATLSTPSRYSVGAAPRLRVLVTALSFWDTAALCAAFLLATFLVAFEPRSLSLQQFLSMRLKLVNFVLFGALLATWRLTFGAFRLYDPQRPLFSHSQIWRVFWAVATCTGLVSLGATAFQISVVSPLFLLAFLGTADALTIVPRLVLRSTFAHRRARARNVLIVGTGPGARHFAHQIESAPETGLRVIGFCDEEWPGIGEFRESGEALLTDFKNFHRLVRETVIDEVVIALPLSALQRIEEFILPVCQIHGITVLFLSNVLSHFGSTSVSRQESSELVTVYHGIVEGGWLVAKRALDVSISLLLLIALSPVFALLAVMIRLDSPGPAFFSQVRVGFNKRPFRMHKFRTMCLDAEEKLASVEHLNEAEGPVFKIWDDPRTTRMGRFLRTTSIDELPQLLNVLKGEMSLVGPRPLPLRDFAGFDEDHHRRRFSVYPGITGLWQVSGRSSVGFLDWMALDLKYVDEWSLLLDVKILMRTIPVVIKRMGAV